VTPEVNGVTGRPAVPGNRAGLRTVLAMIINAKGQISALDVIGDHHRLRRMEFAVLPD
jgi:hypothetical protein